MAETHKVKRPPKKEFWICANCGETVDKSQTYGPCPKCGSDEGYRHYAPKYIS